MLPLFYTPLESTVKQKFRTPFIDDSEKKLIVHCCYHKVGTAWFIRILRSIARYYGLNFQNSIQSDLRRDTDIFMEYMSRVDVAKLPDYIGSHMIRDPRDIIISGYFYHLWTKEEWAHIPRKNLKNLTYQQYLHSFNREEGLLAEMRGTSQETIEEMSRWNYNNPHFIEFKYEDLITNESAVFAKIFRHYGFNEEAIQNCLGIADKFSFKNQSRRKKGIVNQKSHLRSGRTGEWREIFGDRHKQEFKQIFGDVLIKLGYETNNDW
ncbi:sulfotransferase domain-containing protein [Waterburya agarophytonicola K14]|uniref:Sulfotransferase domain-containing protein n=1 Tax=Waterburya agarophytonicola KI4 TaxID=2874699 RepID=A0A964FDS4_9CYAN|nr:sulfotransferase domain-containing protein [Waterburya agarophytonicola]MCC0175945.1 sulfotransferase domain-containing protein [Waterburya agarophytonicola KI4]